MQFNRCQQCSSSHSRVSSPCPWWRWRTPAEIWPWTATTVCSAWTTRCGTQTCSPSWAPATESEGSGPSPPACLCWVGLREGRGLNYTKNSVTFWLVIQRVPPVLGVNDGVDEGVVNGRGLGDDSWDRFGIRVEEAPVPGRFKFTQVKRR